MKVISSITTGPRESNFELLRIIAMFLVLAVHANFYSLESVTKEEFINTPLPSFTRCIFESFAIVCVNVFVLISGYFRIKPSAKGFSNLCFQCLFASVVVYILMLISNTSISLKDYASFLYLMPTAWFIKSYMALYLITPILNVYLDNSSKRTQKNVLITFFVFQTIFGWTKAATFYELGYSAFSFIGLYLLAQYVRNFNLLNSVDRYTHIVIYFTCVFLITLLYFICTMLGTGVQAYAYVNPLVIIGALSLLMFFSKIRVKRSKFINGVAQSCFMVYLLHGRIIWDNVLVFKATAIKIFSSTEGIHCLLYFLIFLIIAFCLCTMIDIPRRFIWKNYIVKFIKPNQNA